MLTQIENTLKNKTTSASTGIVTVIVALYISIVFYLSIWDTLDKIVLCPFLFVASYYCLMVLKPKAVSLKIHLFEQNNTGASVAFYLSVFFIIFGGQLLYWMAFYPGGFNLDAYGQWDQVHGLQQLNNWHPVITTAWYWLITRVWDSFAFCIFVQLLVFSLSASYLLLTLYRLNIHKSLLFFIALYISLNPAIGMNNVCLIKDVLFTIVLIWTTIISIKIVSTRGSWLKSALHSALFVTNIVLVTLIRHNGIFYILPLLLCILIFYRQLLKTIIAIVLFFSLSIAAIQGPLFSAFSVEKHSNFTGESVGIPMSIMANNLLSDPSHTPDDVRVFLLSVVDETEWKNRYILGEWDSCKWDFGGTELFQEEDLGKIVKLGVSSLFAAPNAAFQSVRENTRIVWQVLGPAEWITQVYVEDNDYGIQEKPSNLCAIITNSILGWSTTLLGTFLFWNIGVSNLALMLMLWLVVIRREYPKLLFVTPAIAYNLLTMLLLCGPSHRYFYYNSVLILPIILFLSCTPAESMFPNMRAEPS